MSVNGKKELRELQIGSQRLVYGLQYASTRRLSISVLPDLTVSVTAPRDAEPVDVDRRVRRRAAWLERQLRAFERYHPLPVPRRYVSGESHWYLGRQYRLRIRSGPDAVSLSGGFLLVTTISRRKVWELVRTWYHQRAREVFPTRLATLLKVAPWLDGSSRTLRVREMRRRWGSCGPSGVITLNVELVKAPPSCVDYILAHELSHRLEMSHSKRFYTLLERAVPDWRRARERLNRVVR